MNNDLLGIGSRIKHHELGEGVIINIRQQTYTVVFIQSGKMDVAISSPAIEVIEAVEPDTDLVSISQIERSLIGILNRFSDVQQTVKLGDKWTGGRMILIPGRTDLKQTEIPIDKFFHKIVMLRDRLRVMEQKVNAHTKFTDEEKLEMQQYITRIYGSLTTFNALFKNAEDNFIGQKGKED
ncbi:MAG: hypothetical protein JNK61_12230 [Bacteroidia bacterium]|nr:hypothetical protein [Bacteroidia bacterium]